MTAFSPLLRLRRTWSFHVIAFQRTSKKLCTRIYNAGAQSLFRSLDILFGGVFIAVVVMACLLSLACNRQSSETALIFLEGVINMEVWGCIAGLSSAETFLLNLVSRRGKENLGTRLFSLTLHYHARTSKTKLCFTPIFSRK